MQYQRTMFVWLGVFFVVFFLVMVGLTIWALTLGDPRGAWVFLFGVAFAAVMFAIARVNVRRIDARAGAAVE